MHLVETYTFTLTMLSVQLILFILPALTQYSQLTVSANQVLNGEFIFQTIDTAIVLPEI